MNFSKLSAIACSLFVFALPGCKKDQALQPGTGAIEYVNVCYYDYNIYLDGKFLQVLPGKIAITSPIIATGEHSVEAVLVDTTQITARDVKKTLTVLKGQTTEFQFPF